MQTYSKYAPTQLDHSGAFLPDRQDWLVVPVGRTRDSDQLSESNFETALELLGGESDDVEVHRFGHWGPGWFEIILVKPDTEAARVAGNIETRLENYPILNEEDYSEREQNEYYDNWTREACREFKHGLVKEFDLDDETSDNLYEISKDDFLEFFESLIPSGEYHDSDGYPRVQDAIANCDIQDLAEFLRRH